MSTRGMEWRIPRTVAGALAMMLLLGCCTGKPKPTSRDGLPFFFAVDGHLYRGGQPTEAGFRNLARMGIKTVINLRAEDHALQAHDRQLVESLGMQWVHVPMRSYWRPSDAQVRTFLTLATDPQRQPVFLHCRKGEDRTGSLVAIYRIAQQGWSPQRAYAEARSLGLAGWNPFMRYAILHKTQADYNQATAYAN